MKRSLLLTALLIAGASAAFGQGRPTPERKTMIFQPGAKTPDAPAGVDVDAHPDRARGFRVSDQVEVNKK